MRLIMEQLVWYSVAWSLFLRKIFPYNTMALTENRKLLCGWVE